MIYKDVLDIKTTIIRPLVQSWVDNAIANQLHKNDFFIIFLNGFFDEDLPTPYVYSKSSDWHEIASKSFDSYIKWYLGNSFFTQQQKIQINYTEPAFKDFLISIHNEKSIYLRYWEADETIKILYQITRLSSGLSYDWQWKQKIEKYNSRQEFIRKFIKEPTKKYNQEGYQFLANIIKRQIRNAIAHSQYCLLNNNIKYLNFKSNDSYSNIAFLSYDEWCDIIHNTIVFRNELVNKLNQIYTQYIETANSNNNIIEIRIRKEVDEYFKFKIN